jgi:hypothetical protein
MSAAPLFWLRIPCKINPVTRENLHMIGDHFISAQTYGWDRPRFGTNHPRGELPLLKWKQAPLLFAPSRDILRGILTHVAATFTCASVEYTKYS